MVANTSGKNGGEICPVSGLPIQSNPDWAMSAPDESYKVRFTLIGEEILYSCPSGFATSRITQQSVRLAQKVEDFILSTRPSYVQIENFTDLDGFTVNARLSYIHHLKKRKGIHCLIFFGVSSLTSISIKIAVKLYLIGFHVSVVNSYEEALGMALEINRTRKEASGSRQTVQEPFFSKPSLITQANEGLVPFSSLSDPGWGIDVDGFYARYEIINDHIIHCEAQGAFEKERIEPITELQEKLYKVLQPNKNGFHLIADVSKLTVPSYHTRLLYAEAQKAFFEKYRFESLIFYGASKALKAAVYLGRPVVKFKVHLAQTLEESMCLVYNQGAAPKEGITTDRHAKKDLHAYESDILKYLGSLNLDVEAPGDETVQFSDTHPFSTVFETIDLINHDLSQLALQRQKDELQKIELERKLANAQKLQALGTLSGGIAHDFNNILSGIIGYCRLAERNIDSPLKAKKQIDQIYKGAIRAADLIKQILIFSRKTEYKKTPQELAPVIEEAMILLRSSIPSTIVIEKNILSRSMVLVDSAKIHQIVMNLCTNAYQAMDDTGGTLSISLTDVEVSDSRHPDNQMTPGDYVMLEVADTGPGMDQKTLDRIFDPFFTTKDIGKGTGLGLSIVYAIVQEHDGCIKVDSTPDAGSRMKIYLPVTKQSLYTRKKERPPEKISMGKERIMIVDDEVSILKSTKNILVDSGYQVSCFTDGKTAFNAFAKDAYGYDLVLTDMTMPGMTGDILAKKILEIRGDLPIVLCTGYSEKVSEEKALALGIRKFILKPIDQPLNEIIRDTLDSEY